jgi:hypothetical protein
MKFMDRYVNNEILKSVSRPQDNYNCSLASLTAVVNYLYNDERGILTMDNIADLLGFASRTDSEINAGPSNQQVMDWFNIFVKQKTLRGTTRIEFNQKSVLPWDPAENRKTLSQLKETLHSRDQILIYHKENHYLPVCGYYECASDPVRSYTEDLPPEVWIILGDHYIKNPPVYAKRWGDIRNDFIDNWEGSHAHCFILFERN